MMNACAVFLFLALCAQASFTGEKIKFSTVEEELCYHQGKLVGEQSIPMSDKNSACSFIFEPQPSGFFHICHQGTGSCLAYSQNSSTLSFITPKKRQLSIIIAIVDAIVAGVYVALAIRDASKDEGTVKEVSLGYNPVVKTFDYAAPAILYSFRPPYDCVEKTMVTKRQESIKPYYCHWGGAEFEALYYLGTFVPDLNINRIRLDSEGKIMNWYDVIPLPARVEYGYDYDRIWNYAIAEIEKKNFFVDSPRAYQTALLIMKSLDKALVLREAMETYVFSAQGKKNLDEPDHRRYNMAAKRVSKMLYLVSYAARFWDLRLPCPVLKCPQGQTLCNLSTSDRFIIKSKRQESFHMDFVIYNAQNVTAQITLNENYTVSIGQDNQYVASESVSNSLTQRVSSNVTEVNMTMVNSLVSGRSYVVVEMSPDNSTAYITLCDPDVPASTFACVSSEMSGVHFPSDFCAVPNISFALEMDNITTTGTLLTSGAEHLVTLSLIGSVWLAAMLV